MALIKGMHHVALKCEGPEEFEKTVEFYRDVLGLAVERAWGEGSGSGIMFRAGESLIEIFANAPERLSQGAVRHFALGTDDADGCAEAARRAGYKVTVEPKEIAIPSEPPFRARIAFCVGPAGEEIEFFQER